MCNNNSFQYDYKLKLIYLLKKKYFRFLKYHILKKSKLEVNDKDKENYDKQRQLIYNNIWHKLPYLMNVTF